MLPYNIRKRRELSYRIHNNEFSDSHLEYEFKDKSDDDLINTVILFFENESELEFPAKYIFCNIVYSYFLNKYFGLDFYKSLNDRDTLFDSPYPLLYEDNKKVYDSILAKVMPNIESYTSIIKTRKYFKQEFLIQDEDLSGI